MKMNAMMRGFLMISVLTCAAMAATGEGVAPTWAPAMFPESPALGTVVHTPFRGSALKAINAEWVRVTVRWGQCEKETWGAYDWQDADKVLNYYRDQGFKIICVLTVERLCPLYEDVKNDQGAVIDAIAKWMGAAGARYRGRGILWELGNEPEVFPMNGYWNNPETYAAMARKAAGAIKAADPEAKVGVLSVAWMDRAFISRALETGLLDDGTIDALTYHGYHRKNLLPESGLADDVEWLRGQVKQYAPKEKHVIVVDSERGYAIVDFLARKHWGSWRTNVYTESEQAAYLARHYLETLFLGVEIAVWYKDMNGEDGFSLYYGTDEDSRGLRPCGHVFRNLAALFRVNAKKMRNATYPVALTDPPDKQSAPDGLLQVRSYLMPADDGKRLVVTAWNPVEAFDGKILDNRKRIGDYIYESWRAISESDAVAIPTQVQVTGLSADRVKSAAVYNLLAEKTEDASTAITMDAWGNGVASPELKIGPMPTVVVIDLKK